jgi:hypothetical protein
MNAHPRPSAALSSHLSKEYLIMPEKKSPSTDRPTTMATGEEGGGGPTTMATGEEDVSAPTTMATGEEGSGGPTTMAIGEEETRSTIKRGSPFGSF